jgi:hypothetical protein
MPRSLELINGQAFDTSTREGLLCPFHQPYCGPICAAWEIEIRLEDAATEMERAICRCMGQYGMTLGTITGRFDGDSQP